MLVLPVMGLARPGSSPQPVPCVLTLGTKTQQLPREGVLTVVAAAQGSKPRRVSTSQAFAAIVTLTSGWRKESQVSRPRGPRSEGGFVH